MEQQLQAELQQKEVAQRNAAQEMEKLQKQLQAEIAKGKELAAKLENSEQSRKSAADRVRSRQMSTISSHSFVHHLSGRGAIVCLH